MTFGSGYAKLAFLQVGIEVLEVWKEIPGFEKFYEVSSEGNLRSLDRKIQDSRGLVFFKKGRVLKQTINSKGYKIVILNKNGKSKYFSAHSLVCLAFFGPRPINYDVCHNDGDKQNNKTVNLRYDTRRNNHFDKKLHGTDLRFEKHPKSKLTNDQVVEIQNLIGFLTQKQIANRYSVSQSTISLIKLKKIWIGLNG